MDLTDIRAVLKLRARYIEFMMFDHHETSSIDGELGDSRVTFRVRARECAHDIAVLQLLQQRLEEEILRLEVPE